jgi:hypothetical protein
VLLALVLVACSADPTAPAVTATRGPVTDQAVLSAPAATPSGYDRELATLDAALSGYESLAEAHPDQASRHATVAAIRQSRARLTGDWSDYQAAEAALGRAYALSAEGVGPHLQQAGLDYTLHRLDRVEPRLHAAESAVLVDDPTRSAITLRRGLVALQSGRVVDAAALLDEAEALHADPAPVLGQALLAWRTGDLELADARFVEAAESLHTTSAEPEAWLHLQRGLLDLDRGRLDDALAHYRAADAVLDGYWLVDEHIAEVQWRQGDTASAEATLVDVVERTGGPEYMGMLAELALERGAEAEAAAWVARADAIYAEQLAMYPEAAAGHALDHALRFGSPAAALSLAEANAQTRPNGAALATLAEARLGVGDPAGAVSAAEAALATGWRSADIWLAVAAAYGAAGRTEDAELARAAALAFDPTCLD